MGGIYSSLVYFPPPTSYDNNSELYWVTKENSSNSEKVPTYYFSGLKNRPTIIYSHGNGEDIGLTRPLIEDIHRKLNVNIVIYEYTGYGHHPGKRSESNCYDDIRAVYNHLTKIENVKSEDIILYGRSLGSGPTVHLANEIYIQGGELRGMILESPLESAIRVVSRTLAHIPFADIFQNINKIDKVLCPVLIMHGNVDEVVPYEHGEALSKKVPNLWKFVTIEGAGHNDIETIHWKLFWKSLKDFISHIWTNEK